MADRYASWRELDAAETRGDGYDIVLEREGRNEDVVVIAPHGGRTEPGTDRLARALSGEEYTYYAFLARQRGLHVVSEKFDEPIAVEVVSRARIAVAVHGKRSPENFVMVGGLHPVLVERIKEAFHENGFRTKDPPLRVAGKHPRNICNRCREGGIQLEVSRGLRDFLRSNKEAERSWVNCVRKTLAESVVEDESER